MTYPFKAQLDEMQADLRELRAWLRHNPKVKGYIYGLRFSCEVSTWDSDKGAYVDLSIQDIADIVRAMSEGAPIGTVRKNAYGDSMSYVRKMSNGHAAIELNVSRKAVCVAKVVGTKSITVPDPDAPRITKQVDDIEWECLPLLAAVEPVNQDG